MALVICSSASAEDLRCSASNDMTVHPFSEISEAQAKIYMPNLKQFDSSLFEPIPDYDSKLYVESVDGHRNQTQKINWRLLPSGKILAIAKWPVDNWMGHFELKRKYSCVEVSDSTIQSAGAGASAGAGVLNTSEVPLEDFTHFRKATLYTSNKENNTLIAFNEKKPTHRFLLRVKCYLTMSGVLQILYTTLPKIRAPSEWSARPGIRLLENLFHWARRKGPPAVERIFLATP